MRIQDLFLGPVTLKSLLVILLIVGSYTALNNYLYPPLPQTDEDDGLEFYEIFERIAWLNYTRYDIFCWYPEGMTIEETPIESGGFSYTEGAIHCYGTPTESNRAFIHAGEYFLVWSQIGTFNDMVEALNHAIHVTGYNSCIGYDENLIQKKSPMLTWQGHHVFGGYLNGTGQFTELVVGIFEVHECIETGRVFAWTYLDFENYVPASFKNNGSIFFATYRCHPIEEDWIASLIEN